MTPHRLIEEIEEALARWADPARWALTLSLGEALIIFYRVGLSQLSQDPPPAAGVTSNQAALAKGIQRGLRMAEGEASCDCNICLRRFASSEFMKASRLCR
jgi:hypothetical protein